MRSRLAMYGLEETITRPVIIQILQDISKEIGCFTDPYLYIDENSGIKKVRNRNKSSLATNRNDPISKLATKPKEVLRVNDFSDTVKPGYETDPSVLNPATKPILVDPEIHFLVRPVLQYRKIELNIEYSTTDKIYLTSILEKLKMLPVFNEGQFLHHIEYSYSLPLSIRRLLGHIYVRKQAEWSEEEHIMFKDYIYSLADDRLTQYVSQSEKFDNLEIGFTEKQMECLGYITEDINSLKAEETDFGYGFSFSYTFHFQMPIGYDLIYPILVYNRPLDKKVFTNPKKKKNGRSYNQNYTSDFHGLRTLFQNPIPSEYMKQRYSYGKIPACDEELPNNYPSSYIRLLTQLIIVDPKDPTNVLNLDDLQKEIKFKPYVYEFIKNEFRHVVRRNSSYLYFCIYENNKLLENKLTLDENGNFKTTFDMDMRKTYRLCLFILRDLDVLEFKNRARILKFLKDNLEVSRNFCSTQNEILLLENKNGDGLLKSQILTIKNKYLSTLEIFRNIYGLTQEDVDKIEKQYGVGIDIGLSLKYTNKPAPKGVQIFKQSFINLFE